MAEFHASIVDTLQAKKITILGLGREGLSTYTFLRWQLPQTQLLLIDDKELDLLNSEWQSLVEQDPLSTFMTSSEALATNAQLGTLIVKTPGLKPTHPVLAQAREQSLTVTSNTQLLFDLISRTNHLHSSNRKISIIGVTGTKGKSTTTSMIHHLLKMGGLQAFLGGNIGVPALDLWPTIEEALRNDTQSSIYLVLELSSHQLLDLHVSPHIAVLQNIVPEHLDYYASFDDYVAAKSRITQFQTTEDLVIYNPDYTLPTQLATQSRGKKMTFSTQGRTDSTVKAWVENDQIVIDSRPLLSTDKISLPGSHNLENIMPGIVIAHQLGVRSEKIVQGLTSFKGLAHRLEFVGEVNRVKYYNDSLATVQDAAMAAIEAFKNKDLILIAGGYDRGLEFGELAKTILQHQVIAVLLFKPTGERIAHAIHAHAHGGHEPVMYFPASMSEAVLQAQRLAKPGAVVLLSPASPSFGQFKDYRDRGDQFRAAVAALVSQ